MRGKVMAMGNALMLAATPRSDKTPDDVDGPERRFLFSFFRHPATVCFPQKTEHNTQLLRQRRQTVTATETAAS